MRSTKRARRFQFEAEDDDPLSGVANLFDLAMVVGAALMIALVARPEISDLMTEQDVTMVKNPGQSDMEIIVKKGREITRYKGSKGKETSGSAGRRVGVAYQLEDGRIIYVPEDGTKTKAD